MTPRQILSACELLFLNVLCMYRSSPNLDTNTLAINGELMGQGIMLADSTGIKQANRGEWIRTK
ncbi:MAG: hypothetical protein OXC46_02295 [Thaumarchaeota archaeon]|nr:hypothetical protein [Nitrososphaerota archaeon]